MRVIANTKNMDHKQWLSYRPLGIGGSEASTTVNQNPYQTKFGLYLEKRGEIPAFEGNEFTKWGTKLEDIIATEFKEQNDIWVQRKNFILQHDKHDFMIGNIDREIFHPDKGRGVLEIKNSGFYMGQAWENEQAPAQYILQMQHYLGITGYEYGYFATLIGGNKYHQIEIERDDEIIEILIEAEAKFMEHVNKGIEPELTGTDAEAEILKRLYPEATQTEPLPLEATAAELIKKRQELKEQLKIQDEELKSVENQLKNMLGDYEKGMIDNSIVVWQNISSNRVDSTRLKKEFPDIYNKVTKISKYRKFDIKEAK